MRRERIDNAWQPWRWVLADVVPHEDGFGDQPRWMYRVKVGLKSVLKRPEPDLYDLSAWTTFRG